MASAITPNRQQFRHRCQLVYGEGAPSCGKPGPNRATCVLPPNHDGTDHEGNGFDAWGPLYRQWSDGDG